MSIVIGLVGGICAGKSTVSKLFEDRGHCVVDADKLGHAAYLPGTDCYKELVAHFGDGVVNPDQTINRRALGSIVFADPVKMRELEAIVWPHIRNMIQDKIKEFRREDEDLSAASGSASTDVSASASASSSSSAAVSAPPSPRLLRVLVIEAAIMLDAGWQDLVDQVWVLEVEPETALQRLMTRNNLSREESEKRLSSQKSNEWRRGFATTVG